MSPLALYWGVTDDVVTPPLTKVYQTFNNDFGTLSFPNSRNCSQAQQ